MNDQWKSYNKPPDVPLITGGARKVPRRDTLSEAITSAALAVAKAFSVPQQSNAAKTPVQSGVSPMRKARLSSEYITQLNRYKSFETVAYSVTNTFLNRSHLH